MLYLLQGFLFVIATALRTTFLRMLTSLVVGLPAQEVQARILGLSRLDQVTLVGATFGGLLLTSSLMAEAGPGAPFALYAAIRFVVR